MRPDEHKSAAIREAKAALTKMRERSLTDVELSQAIEQLAAADPKMTGVRSVKQRRTLWQWLTGKPGTWTVTVEFQSISSQEQNQ